MSRDILNYRKLTDKPVSKEERKKEAEEETSKETTAAAEKEESKEEQKEQSQDDAHKTTSVDDETIGLGKLICLKIETVWKLLHLNTIFHEAPFVMAVHKGLVLIYDSEGR